MKYIYTMWFGIFLATTTYALVAWAEIMQAGPAAHGNVYEVLVDKVPGLAVLVFLVVVFFRHMDKRDQQDVNKAEIHRKTIETLVAEFKQISKEQVASIAKVEARVEQLVFRTPPNHLGKG